MREQPASGEHRAQCASVAVSERPDRSDCQRRAQQEGSTAVTNHKPHSAAALSTGKATLHAPREQTTLPSAGYVVNSARPASPNTISSDKFPARDTRGEAHEHAWPALSGMVSCPHPKLPHQRLPNDFSSAETSLGARRTDSMTRKRPRGAPDNACAPCSTAGHTCVNIRQKANAHRPALTGPT